MKLKCLQIVLIVFPALVFFATNKGNAQSNDSSPTPAPQFKISGYVDAYYAYFTDSVGTGEFQKWPTISSRSNQFGLNTMMLTAQYDADRVRGIVSIHYGDIAKSAWSNTYNPILEAHAGVRLSKKVWLDAGFFRTHIGTEGLLPKENICSSIAVGTFNEPYYQSGARLNYKSNKLEVNLFALNGYNLFEETNKKKSLGLQVLYALNDKGSIGYCNYIGDDSPDADSVSHLRIYHNLFFNYDANKIKLQIGGDYGSQKNSDLRDTLLTKNANVFSGIIAIKYKIKKVHGIYARYEIFNDPTGFLGGMFTDKTGKQTGYILGGITVGGEYKPTDNTYIRIEGRQIQLDKDQEFFYTNSKNTNARMEIFVNLGISF
ncbi:MAG: outer membrane beta-barrel protein [Saprospiraceae bacterium]